MLANFSAIEKCVWEKVPFPEIIRKVRPQAPNILLLLHTHNHTFCVGYKPLKKEIHLKNIKKVMMDDSLVPSHVLRTPNLVIYSKA